MAMKVCSIAGHGGADSGAVSGKFVEKCMALTIDYYFTKELRRWGVVVKRTRTSNKTEVGINRQCQIANSFGADLTVAHHINAGKGDGAEVICSVTGKVGRRLANNILKELKKIGQNSRGVKTRVDADGNDYFGNIRYTNMPAVIVEYGFLDNKKDRKIMDTKEELKALGIAAAQGVLDTEYK